MAVDAMWMVETLKALLTQVCCAMQAQVYLTYSSVASQRRTSVWC